MKPFYIPNALISATEKVILSHPKTARVISPLSASDLKNLVLTIDGKELAELPLFARTVSLRQRMALCTYLPSNAYEVSLEKITLVLSSNMSVSMFQMLFDIWQNHPRCKEVLSLLGKKAMEAAYQSSLPISGELLAAWAQSPVPLYAVALTCRDKGKGVLFLERLNSMGFSMHKPLATACFSQYLQHANITTFQAEGDKAISTLLSNVDTAQQARILLRLLGCCKGNPSLLLTFRDVYDYAYRLWGEPHTIRFPKGEEALLPTYRWWYNYQQIQRAFRGDRRRINYWKQYLHLCTCVRNEKHSMLIMHYGSAVVTEFEVQGAVYIFEKEYFKRTVAPRLYTTSSTMLKSWLVNHSAYKSREMHMANWERKQTLALRINHII